MTDINALESSLKISYCANGHSHDLHLIGDYIVREKTRKHAHRTTAYPYSFRESLEKKERKKTTNRLTSFVQIHPALLAWQITKNLPDFPAILTDQHEGEKKYYAKFSLKAKIQS